MEDSLPFKVQRASVKGKLGGQAWLTQVPYLVRRGPKECNSLGMLGGQAWLTQVPCLVRPVPEEFTNSRSGAMSLGGPWYWSEAMVCRSQYLKLGRVPSGTVEEIYD